MYTQTRASCPACASPDIEENWLISKEGFMSAPGVSHAGCHACGTVFVNPEPTPEDLKDFYLSQAMESAIAVRSSAERVLEPGRRAYFTIHRIEPLKSFLKLDGAFVFDVGCGVGAFIRLMKEEGSTVSGCDISPVSVQAGKDILGLSGQEIYQGDIHAIREGQYDLITLWTVIEHLLEPEAYLRKLHDYLAPGGYVLLEFPTVDSAMFEYSPEDFFWIMPPYHLTIFSRAGMGALLRRTGFEPVHEAQMPKNWYFFDVAARKLGLHQQRIATLKEQEPGLTFEMDSLFDRMAYQMGKASSRWVLARKAG